MIKQTRGALNFLIASYKAILKHAVLATALSSVAIVSTANAKTYDLSDDNSYFTKDSVGNPEIIDDANDDETIISKTKDPSFDGERNIIFLTNNSSKMKFTDGGKLNVKEYVQIKGESFDATNTEITAKTVAVYSSDPYYEYKSANFGKVRALSGFNAAKGIITASEVSLDKGSASEFYSLVTDNFYVGKDENSAPLSNTLTSVYIGDFAANNSLFTSSFDKQTNLIVINGGGYTGKMAIGPNTVVVIGFDKDNETESYLSFTTNMLKRIGGLSNVTGQGYNAVLYIKTDGIFLGDKGGLTIDGSEANPTVTKGTLRIGPNSAIVLSKETTQSATVKERSDMYSARPVFRAPFYPTPVLEYSDSSRIILDSTAIKAGSRFRIHSGFYIRNTDGEYAGNLVVQSVNGNFKTYLINGTGGLGTGETDLKDVKHTRPNDTATPKPNDPSIGTGGNDDNSNIPGSGISKPNEGGNSKPNTPNTGDTGSIGTTTPGTGDSANGGNSKPGTDDNGNTGNAGITTPCTPDNGNKPGNSGNTTTPSLPGLPGTGTIYETFTRGDYTNLGNTLHGLLHNTINDANAKGTGSEFLSAVAGETFTGGKEAEQAARLGQLGGVYQSAFTVSSITDDIVSSRNGVGSSTGSLIVSDNNNGFGIWLSPMVKVASSDGFDSDGLSYGTRVRLTDFAIGADYTLNNGSRVGAYFHTGNGKSTGKGLASHTDGDLKYYGAGLYGKYSYNNFSLLADVSYNKITDDVDTDLGLQSYSRASASVDTYIVKAGLTGQYNFNVNTVSVIPHAGVRYTTLKSDDYSVQAKGLYIANVKSDRTKVVSFPVGVTVEKAFNVGQTDWKVKPAVDLGVNFNTGDTDASYKTTFIGANEASLNAEIADSVVYTAGAGLKFSHQKNADIEAGVVYAASENTNDVTFHVNGSYQF